MNRPLRGALIGFGFIAENGHAPAYGTRTDTHGDIELVAIADICEPRQRHARRCYPGLPVYEDARRMLDDASLALDFVDIAVPPRDHAPLAHAALDRGLHVLCEKPLAIDYRAARALLDHAGLARRVLYPCHNYKHAPIVKAVSRAIGAGAIGVIRRLTLQTFRPTHARGVVEWRPDWRRDRVLAGGGIGMDHGSHTFYLALEWLRSTPRAVTAMTMSQPGQDTEEDLACTITFPNGVVEAYLTWAGGTRKVLYTVHGSKGAIRVEDDDLEISCRDPGSPSGWRAERATIASHWMDASHAAWFASLLGDFVAAIDAGDFVSSEAKQALTSVQLIDAAYASARQGSRLVWLASDGAPPPTVVLAHETRGGTP